jgi:hypothetical protein
VFGCKTLQFSHAGQSTLGIQPGAFRLNVLHFPDTGLPASKYIGTAVTVLVQIVRNW